MSTPPQGQASRGWEKGAPPKGASVPVGALPGSAGNTRWTVTSLYVKRYWEDGGASGRPIVVPAPNLHHVRFS